MVMFLVTLRYLEAYMLRLFPPAMICFFNRYLKNFLELSIVKIIDYLIIISY